ncbi:DnaJ-domain-containing protein [Byssothecium circinans]|uniref:DnaJ-domain-containing protein n=1 Tax=Byssothecium circinans TaxID=147558 RepID=A0A6A5TH20_9PLEO|nr:DnaJ-domain-containing protein [Byssothecium circinans]
MHDNAPIQPEKPDHYFNLKVPQSAPRMQIKKSYNQLVLLHHPDKQGPGASGDVAEFRKVQEAWEILGDETLRAEYDEYYDDVRREWEEYREALDEQERKNNENPDQRRARLREEARAERVKLAEEQRRQEEEEEREREEEEQKRKEEEARRARGNRPLTHAERWEKVFAFREEWRAKAIKEEDAEHENYSSTKGRDFLADGLECYCWGCKWRRQRVNKEEWEMGMPLWYWEKLIMADEKRKKAEEERQRREDEAYRRFEEAVRKDKEERQRREDEAHHRSEEASRKAREEQARQARERIEKERLASEKRARLAQEAAERKRKAKERTAEMRSNEATRRLREEQEKAAQLRIARAHIERQQVAYMQKLQTLQSSEGKRNEQEQVEVVLDLGWKKDKNKNKKGIKLQCLFCAARIEYYAWVCPEGGAVACNPCKNRLSRFVPVPLRIAEEEEGEEKADGDVDEKVKDG